jgi:hypothetical protein
MKRYLGPPAPFANRGYCFVAVAPKEGKKENKPHERPHLGMWEQDLVMRLG